MTLIWVGC